MVNCERFIDILAAGEDASPREAEEAREHAAVCEECGRVAEAFAAFPGGGASTARAGTTAVGAAGAR